MSQENITFQTKSAYVAEMLRHDLAEGKYRPGDRLRAVKLAEGFGLSLTPVREALLELANEGLVELTPHRGARVADVPIADLTEVYFLRQMLESASTRFAAERATEEEIAQLAEHHERFTQAVKAGRRNDLRKLNDEFHAQIYEMARSPLLRRLINTMWAVAPEDTFKVIEERPRRSIEYHEKILKSISEHDTNLAESLMRDHIRDSLDLIRSAKEKQSPADQ